MSLHDKLMEYGLSDFYGFHMPGHKRKVFGVNPYSYDITEIDGFDNLHEASGIIKEEEDRLSEVYGSERSFLLVGGSTLGNLVGIYSQISANQGLLIEENSHKSVYNAAKVANAKVHTLENNSLDEVRKAFSGNPDIKMVVLTSPNYQGYVAPIKEIADFVHEKNALLMIDCAHGAHLGFHEAFPPSPVKLGADIVVMSLHKTMACLTMTAVLHICSDRVDKMAVKEAIDIFETSSPSYVLMDSVSAAFDELQQDNNLFEDYVKNLEDLYFTCREMENIHLLTEENDKRDIGKIVVVSDKPGLTGPKMADILRKSYHIEPEMAASNYIILMTSYADTENGWQRLGFALTDMDVMLDDMEFEENPMPDYSYLLGTEAKQMVCIYPPGSPIVLKGDRYNEKAVKRLEEAAKCGLCIQGLEL